MELTPEDKAHLIAEINKQTNKQTTALFSI